MAAQTLPCSWAVGVDPDITNALASGQALLLENSECELFVGRLWVAVLGTYDSREDAGIWYVAIAY
jgi:hypothetical protein